MNAPVDSIPWDDPVVHLEKLGPVPGEEVGKLLEFGVSFLEFGVRFLEFGVSF